MSGGEHMTEFEQHIRARACTREEIDHFLDPDKLSMWQFDAEVGYILGNYLRREGIDDSLTIEISNGRASCVSCPIGMAVRVRGGDGVGACVFLLHAASAVTSNSVHRVMTQAVARTRCLLRLSGELR